jgi:Protein of unknown function (DUF1236)
MARSVLQFGIAIAVMLLGVAGGQAQTGAPAPTNPNVPAATRTVNLTLEQRHTIRELVQDLKINPVSDDRKVAAGDQVPADVALQPIPPLIGQKVPQIRSHRFYMTKQQIVLVDPDERRVVEVID